jgi:hypothetical protein
MLTQKQIDEIRARCEAATEGPWWWPFGSEALLVEKCGYYCDEKIGHVDHEVVIGRYGGQPHYVKLKDARFIAHARTDIPALLDALEEAQREVDRAKHFFHATYEVLGGNNPLLDKIVDRVRERLIDEGR